jgi:7-cyano-7-deazaguanine synthase
LRSVVLLSGGLDSVVNFKTALDNGAVEVALTFDYGQAAAGNEIQAARECARRFGVYHAVVSLGDYWGLLPEPMRRADKMTVYTDGLNGDTGRMLREAWVPNRNGVFVNIAAAFAEGRGADTVVLGVNREEAEVFPDNSERFLEQANRALAVSTLTGVKAVSFTTHLSKREIVRMGVENGAALDIIYSCYKGSVDRRMCGECQSCIRLKQALAAEGYEGLSSRFER